jgi:eukaryotic-like serine/threonine-protein kinase
MRAMNDPEGSPETVPGPVDSEQPASFQVRPVDGLPVHVGSGSVVNGRWRLERVAGTGGTATVYEATDLTAPAGDRVAVKVLHREMGHDSLVRARFLQEAYVANKIQHPSVVKVLGDGLAEDGSPFLVMELLEGETVDARWERKGWRLPPDEVLWIADRLLDVLAAAHAKGIVHRDVKPENLFLTTDRRLKVLDFGLARLREADRQAGQARTRIGQVMGTPAFMPPEQARGEWDTVGVHADLWSVGASLFSLLSGKIVHDGEGIQEVVEAAMYKAAPSLREAAPDLPDALVDLVDYALAFDREQRWNTARLMQHAVRRAHQAIHRRPRPESEDEDDSTSNPPFDDHLSPPPPSVMGGMLHMVGEPPQVPAPAASEMRLPVAAPPRRRDDAAGSTLPAVGAPPKGEPERPAPVVPSGSEAVRVVALPGSPPRARGRSLAWVAVGLLALAAIAAGALALGR